MKAKILLAGLLVFLLPWAVFAKVGVGVNLGKIQIEEFLKPGGIYKFPSVGVVNTGDAANDYELTVSFRQDQSELKPAKEWFSFRPERFPLEPNRSGNVEVTLNLPLKLPPGNYFCFLEAHPAAKKEAGTTVGVAAATKVYFKVQPANFWQALYYRIASFLKIHSPWTYVVGAVILAAFLVFTLRRFLTFKIGFKKKED